MKKEFISHMVVDTDESSYVLEHRTLSINKSLMAHMTFTGYEYNKSKYVITRQGYKNIYVLNYTISGGGLLTIQKETKVIEPGDLILFSIDDYSVMKTHVNASDHWEFVYIHISGHHVLQVCDYIIHKVGHVIRHSDAKNIMNRILYLHDIIRQKSNKIDYQISEHILGILTELLFFSDEIQQKFLPKDILNILNYMNDNYISIQNLNDLLVIVSMSKSHFLQQFKYYLNISPMHYIHQLKLKDVLTLLRNPHLTLIEIAQMSGFIDERSLLYNFKKQIGMTPKQYKKSLGI